MATANSFKSKVVAKIKGDDAEVLAGKIESRAKSAIRSQIAALEAKKVTANEELDDAKEALEDAIYPSSLEPNSDYIAGIKNAQEEVDEAQEEVESIDESIAYYKKVLDDTFED